MGVVVRSGGCAVGNIKEKYSVKEDEITMTKRKPYSRRTEEDVR